MVRVVTEPPRSTQGRVARSNRHLVSAIILCIAAAVALLTIVGDLGIGAERDLRAMRAGWRQHPATGQVTIVEVDARSVAELNRWPWPHRYFATALDRLGAAHPRSIAFDLDFSSASTPADDRLLAQALQRRGGSVILPTFSQYDRSGSTTRLDTLPLAAFREHAFVAGVNVTPDEDGVVRNYPAQITTLGVTRPSIAAMLAETANPGGRDNYPIDYAIDANTIPRISFVDLVRGRVPAAAIAGKRILFGATSIELGDRYPAPGLNVVPGVVIQALAAETLLQSGLRVQSGPLPLLLMALVGVALVTSTLAGRRRLVALAGLAVATFLVPIPLDAAGFEVDIVPALATTLAALTTAFAAMVLGELNNRRFVDADSGLGNARALQRDAARLGEVDIVVACCDRLTELSAALGATAATAAMVEVARRLAETSGRQVYRVEEDLLGWIAPACDDLDREGDLFRLLVVAARGHLDVGRAGVEMRATFGIARGNGKDAQTLIAGAQIAARRARARGSEWDRFVDGDGDAARWELSLLGGFNDALVNGDVFVVYQPKVSAQDGRIVGAEALVRWRHPDRGMISPDIFVPLLEREGRAAELTAFVLDTAVGELAGWRRSGADVGVAVNVSATLLHHPDIVDMVAAAIARGAIDPAKLTLELTESAIIADAESSIDTVRQLRSLGVRISIDDYGTGQSTLTYLKRFSANELKIDKSFVQNLTHSNSDRLLVQSTVELAHAMKMTVVAEGVEDRACFDALGSMGCDTIQGWYSGKPMSGGEFSLLLDNPQDLAA